MTDSETMAAAEGKEPSAHGTGTEAAPRRFDFKSTIRTHDELPPEACSLRVRALRVRLTDRGQAR